MKGNSPRVSIENLFLGREKGLGELERPFRVLQVFAGLDSGGVSNFVMNLYRELDTAKIQFDFALTSGKRALYDDEVIARGGRIFYFDTSKGLSWNLRRIFKEEGPFRAVHSHLFFYSGIVLAEAKKRNIPVRIAHAHNAHTGESRFLPRVAYERTMQGLIYRNATHLLGCSEKACRYVFGNGVMKDPRAAVLQDGIDCSRFAFDPHVREAVRKEYGIGDRFVIGHVGHFNPAKNHEKILSVFAEVCRIRTDALLLLVGDGELEQDVRKRAAEACLAEKVIFAGAHRDVERFYQAMDVFLFPSRYEGFGMAMIEAQTSGLACVASDVVPEETNADGRAVYLPLEENDALWASMLLQAPSRTAACYQKICDRFDASGTAEKMARIYG